MAGQIVGDRYEIQRSLNQTTGRGTVLARDTQTQDPVVLKIQLCRDSYEAEDLRLFKREAETLRQLNHPSIPKYLDDFELSLKEGQGFVLVQSYIEGQSLQSYLDAGQTFEEADAKQLANGLLQILAYLHHHHPPILHRDIKPSNILLTTNSGQLLSDVYLIDFKSAQNFDTSDTGSFTVIGTYGYSAPELTAGRAVRASDLYSVGMTVISALTGIEPAKLPRKKGAIEFEQLVYLTPGFAHWLNQMVQPGLDKRFSSAHLALQALDQPLPPRLNTAGMHKPTDSQISLTKTRDGLDIVIPSRVDTIRLHLNTQSLKLDREFLGWRYRRCLELRREEVKKMELGDRHLLIWTDQPTCDLNQSNHLTPAELKWLALELREWLKVPITTCEKV